MIKHLASTKTHKVKYQAIAIVFTIIIALSSVGIVPISSTPLSASIQKRTAVHTLIQQAKTAWVTGNADVLATLFTANAEFLVPGNRWVGRAAIRQLAADFAANSSNVTVDIQRILVEGNHASVEWHWEDTDNASGQRNRADDVIVIDFVNGKISRWREYIDTQTPQKLT